MVESSLDLRVFDPRFSITQRPNHAFELAEDAVKQRADIVVAVGGDGTINEVASALEGSQSMMGIVPCGSGNGLARSLGIPLSHPKAIRAINRLNYQTIDTASLNNWKFFNIGGIGFDAHISYCFSKLESRGLRGYINATFNEIVNYKPKYYKLEIDGVPIERKAFMISIANSSQFGNNAHISPTASLTDGLLDVVIVKPFPLYQFPVMGYHMFKKSCDKSRYIEIIKGKNIRIETSEPQTVHVDGEPKEVNSEILIQVKPLSLTVLH